MWEIRPIEEMSEASQDVPGAWKSDPSRVETVGSNNMALLQSTRPVLTLPEISDDAKHEA